MKNVNGNGKNETNLKYRHRLRPSQVRTLWLSRLAIWIGLIVVLFPIITVIAASMAKGDAFQQGSIFPQHWSMENYVKVLTKTNFKIWVKNSMMVCVCVAVLQVLMTATAAYSFSRMKFGFRRSELILLLVLQMFPGMMSISAILGLAYRYGFMDQLWALIVLLVGGNAYNIWLFKGFIDGIPKSLDEAAFIDGASWWQVFWRIIMPLSRAEIAVIFLLSFIGTYGEFVYTSALIKNSSLYTVALGLQTFIKNQFSTNWTQFSAAAIMASLPIMIVFMLLQKFISRGLVSGALKE